MQTKITFNNSAISAQTFNHENASSGGATTSPRAATTRPSTRRATPPGRRSARPTSQAWRRLRRHCGHNAAFEASMVSQFNSTYNSTRASWWRCRRRPDRAPTLFDTMPTYTRPGVALIALRAILGNTNFVSADKIQNTTAAAASREAQAEGILKWLPVDTPPATRSCRRSSSSGGTRPTRPARSRRSPARPLGARASMTPAAANDYGVAPVSGSVGAQLALTLGSPASFGAFTPGVDQTYSVMTANVVDGGRRDAVGHRPRPMRPCLVNGTFAPTSRSTPTRAAPAGTGAAFAPLGATALARDLDGAQSATGRSDDRPPAAHRRHARRGPATTRRR